MVDLLVVADDLTGALDTGAQFAHRGLRARVSWQGVPPGEAGVWVLDTETRECTPSEARRRVAEMATPLAAQAVRLYKKVDSTLRGPIGAELEALLAAAGARQAILAPAFPAQGRTTLHGRHYVRGVPLDETPYAAPGSREPSIAALLQRQTSLPVETIELDTVRRGAPALAAAFRAAPGRVLVVDAVEDGDLLAIARAADLAGPGLLLAGSAGLAAQLPANANAPAATDRPRNTAPEGPVLFVAGTRHPCLAGQLARLEAETPVTVVRQILSGLLVRGEAVVDERSQALAAALVAGDAVVTTEGDPQIAGAGRQVAALLAQVASRALAQVRPGALVLTGGDVAMATCHALGASFIALEGEIEPGIPVGRLLEGPADGLGLVTKAGGFGDDGVLCRILKQMRDGAI